MDGQVEKYSVIKTLRALDECHVAVVLIDACDGITDQDSRLLGLVVESGRGLVLGVNKWDALAEEEKPRLQYELDRKLRFLHFAAIHFVSALNGWGVKRLLDSVDKAGRRRTAICQPRPSPSYSPDWWSGTRLRWCVAVASNFVMPTRVVKTRR